MTQFTGLYRYRFIVIAFCLVIAGPLFAGDFQKGLLWKVQKAGQPASHIYGTMHSEHPSIVALSPPVKKAFGQAKSFTAEMKMDMLTLMQSQMRMMLPPNESLISMIGRQRFTESARLMSQYGIPEQFVEKMKPWAVAVTLQIPKPQGGLALDLALYQQAEARGIKVYGLETIDEQVGLFDNLPSTQQISMLEQSIKDYPEMPGKIDTMMRLYLQRDIGGLMEFSQQEMKRIDPDLAEHMNKNMLVDRNHRMVKRMQPQLAEGNAFIAVGALHLPGEQGILQLLENQGYKLISVY